MYIISTGSTNIGEYYHRVYRKLQIHGDIWIWTSDANLTSKCQRSGRWERKVSKNAITYFFGNIFTNNESIYIKPRPKWFSAHSTQYTYCQLHFTIENDVIFAIFENCFFCKIYISPNTLHIGNASFLHISLSHTFYPLRTETSLLVTRVNGDVILRSKGRRSILLGKKMSK